MSNTAKFGFIGVCLSALFGSATARSENEGGQAGAQQQQQQQGDSNDKTQKEGDANKNKEGQASTDAKTPASAANDALNALRNLNPADSNIDQAIKDANDRINQLPDGPGKDAARAELNAFLTSIGRTDAITSTGPTTNTPIQDNLSQNPTSSSANSAPPPLVQPYTAETTLLGHFSGASPGANQEINSFSEIRALGNNNSRSDGGSVNNSAPRGNPVTSGGNSAISSSTPARIANNDRTGTGTPLPPNEASSETQPTGGLQAFARAQGGDATLPVLAPTTSSPVNVAILSENFFSTAPVTSTTLSSSPQVSNLPVNSRTPSSEIETPAQRDSAPQFLARAPNPEPGPSASSPNLDSPRPVRSIASTPANTRESIGERASRAVSSSRLYQSVQAEAASSEESAAPPLPPSYSAPEPTRGTASSGVIPRSSPTYASVFPVSGNNDGNRRSGGRGVATTAEFAPTTTISPQGIFAQSLRDGNPVDEPLTESNRGNPPPRFPRPTTSVAYRAPITSVEITPVSAPATSRVNLALAAELLAPNRDRVRGIGGAKPKTRVSDLIAADRKAGLATRSR